MLEDDDKTFCLCSFPEKGQGESCSSATECLVTDSICDGGQCACPSTMYLQGMTCLNSK